MRSLTKYYGQWDQGKIVRFGWTLDEHLAVLNEEGVYRVYDLQGDYQQHSLGSEAAEMGIIDARIHENGLVALTGSLTLMEVKGWEGAKPLTLANPGKVLTTCIILSLQPSLQVSHNHHIRGASFLPI